MPPRPNKKAMEGTGGVADPFWVAEQQSDEIVEEEDRSPRKVFFLVKCYYVCVGSQPQTIKYCSAYLSRVVFLFGQYYWLDYVACRNRILLT